MFREYVNHFWKIHICVLCALFLGRAMREHGLLENMENMGCSGSPNNVVRFSNLWVLIVIDCLFLFLSSLLKTKIAGGLKPPQPPFPSNNISTIDLCVKKETTFWVGHFTTISGHFFSNYIYIFHKIEVLKIILRCLTCLNLNWIKSYHINHNLFWHFVFQLFRRVRHLKMIFRTSILWKI